MIDGLIAFFHSIISPLFTSFNWVNVLEICFIGLILLVFYRKFIRNTQSENLVKGLFFLVFALIFSEILILGLNKQIKQGLLRDYIEADVLERGINYFDRV